MLRKIINLSNSNLDKITLASLEEKILENQFDRQFIQELVTVFKNRIEKSGEEKFQKWIVNLHFRIPEEYQNEQTAIRFYDYHQQWIEEEIVKLENEIKLSWEVQTEDVKDLDHKARKAQLMIRHRVTEVVLELL